MNLVDTLPTDAPSFLAGPTLGLGVQIRMKVSLTNFSCIDLVVGSSGVLTYFHCRPGNGERVVWARVTFPTLILMSSPSLQRRGRTVVPLVVDVGPPSP